MSDEFLKLATTEINDELFVISSILNSCHVPLDISANALKIQKSTHKIKGLAPMMGKGELGILSSLLDSMLKKLTADTITDEIFESIILSIDSMKNSMIDSNFDLSKIKQRISQLSSSID